MSTGSSSLTVQGSSQPSTSDDMSASIYRERLKVLRARCGFDNTNSDSINQAVDSGSEKVKIIPTSLKSRESNSSLSSNNSSIEEEVS